MQLVSRRFYYPDCVYRVGFRWASSVRVSLAHDASTRAYEPVEKYWHEAVFHEHYDGRFADHQLSYVDQQTNLSAAIQAYLGTMADLGIETWIMHGTLLGWFWNRKIMPWDSDIDVQVELADMHFLASYYNMTMHRYSSPTMPNGRRKYLLEINPGYVNGSKSDVLNAIDARWIDTETGVFIDITSVRPKKGEKGALTVKDTHEYSEGDIFPLINDKFEGKPVKIPRLYAKLLEIEYGRDALMNTKFERHEFNSMTLEWTPDLKLIDSDKHYPET